MLHFESICIKVIIMHTHIYTDAQTHMHISTHIHMCIYMETWVEILVFIIYYLWYQISTGLLYITNKNYDIQVY